jgi:hypothetical protein
MIVQLERLKELLDYDARTGIFTWKKAAANRTVVGSIAGTFTVKGYVKIQIDRRMYSAHRLAWFYFYGTWPDGIIDHINRNKKDNRIINLRVVSASQNMRNCDLRATNTSGHKGVSYFAHRRKWAAQIRIHGKNWVVGMFDTPEAASAAYKNAAESNGLEY